MICALPVEIIERVSNMRSAPSDDDAEVVAGDEAEVEDAPVVDREIENFRGALKARTLELRVPIQIVWPTTYDNNAVVKRKARGTVDAKGAGRGDTSLELLLRAVLQGRRNAVAHGPRPREYSATFMGVSFFEGLDGSSLQTSSAQLFDERGEGLILKGGPGLKDKTDRQPYPSAIDAFSLTRTALQSYKKEHGNYPARLVVHKTSRFHPEEREGFQKAIEQSEIEIADFIWMPRRSPVRLFRNGVYPPLRGTAMRLDDEQTILYTRGSVDFFRTYPGLYVPNPLVLHAQRRDTPRLESAAQGNARAHQDELERHPVRRRAPHHLEGRPPGRGHPEIRSGRDDAGPPVPLLHVNSDGGAIERTVIDISVSSLEIQDITSAAFCASGPRRLHHFPR